MGGRILSKRDPYTSDLVASHEEWSIGLCLCLFDHIRFLPPGV